ncbi:MAG TPA: phage portal protein, partial [Lacipirellula sp.]
MLLDAIFGRSSTRSLTPSPSDDYWYNPVGLSSAAGVRVDERTAINYSAVWCATRIICETTAWLPFVMFEKQASGGKREAVNHPIYPLVVGGPNQGMTNMIFREVMTARCVNWGNAYAEIERTRGGVPLNLWPIHPSRVKISDTKRETDGRITYFVTNDDGGKTPVEAANMIHLIGANSDDGLFGRGVVRFGRESIGMGLATERYGAGFFGNGARPGGVLEHPGKLGETAQKNLRESWNRVHQGPGSGHNLAILEEGMKYHTIDIPPEQAQFLETRTFNITEIARWYGLPPHKLAELSRATFCMPSDVMVFSKDGPKSVADISVGESVWSYDDRGLPVLSRVLRSACTGFDEVLTIEARGRILRCNAKHRVLISREVTEPYRGGRGQYLTVGGEKVRKAWKEMYVPAGEIREGDYLIAAESLPGIGSSSAPTREASVEFMEALGMLAGDGFYARTGKRKYEAVFGISHGANDKYLPHYVSCIEKEFEQYAEPYGTRSQKTKPLSAKRRDKNTTVFYSTKAMQELRACGMVGKAKTKRVPMWVFGLRRELILAFLRGYLDSDGTVSKTGHIRYSSCNEKLLEDVRHLCILAGVRCSNIFATERESRFKGYESTRSLLYGFICSDVKANMLIGSHTPMYNERFAEKLARRRSRNVAVYPCEAKQRAKRDCVGRCKVESITRSTVLEPVYDLEVEGTHCFIANGVVVHNSNIEHQA